MPIYAQLETASGTLFVMFDRPLEPGTASADPWTIRANNHVWKFFGGVTTLGKNASGTANELGVFFGPNRITYSASPKTLFDTAGRPLDPFIGFPLFVL